jgi:hypothetical protein
MQRIHRRAKAPHDSAKHHTADGNAQDHGGQSSGIAPVDHR